MLNVEIVAVRILRGDFLTPAKLGDKSLWPQSHPHAAPTQKALPYCRRFAKPRWGHQGHAGASIAFPRHARSQEHACHLTLAAATTCASATRDARWALVVRARRSYGHGKRATGASSAADNGRRFHSLPQTRGRLSSDFCRKRTSRLGNLFIVDEALCSGTAPRGSPLVAALPPKKIALLSPPSHGAAALIESAANLRDYRNVKDQPGKCARRLKATAVPASVSRAERRN